MPDTRGAASSTHPLVMLPGSVSREVGIALEDRDSGSIVSSRSIQGGCIHTGARIETDTGDAYFLKWHPSAPCAVFEAEAEGLRALAARCPLTVPTPLAIGPGTEGPSWLLMEWVEHGSPHAPDFPERLGEGLAALHAPDIESVFGWARNNWIGSLAQENTETERWPDFWRERRIVPQLAAARRSGFLQRPIMDRLVQVIPDALRARTSCSLLHGDLWNGNVFADGLGQPVLIDPAVYRGDAEADLAMMELFGGFSDRVFDAYAAVRPIPPEYPAFRRDLYQLYYLLVHVNLFGESYEPACESAAERVVREVE